MPTKAGLRVNVCVAQNKSTLYHTERRREAKAPECCSQIAELPCMCACMNENAVSLQPADSMAASVLAGQLQPLPLCMYVTERYADDMLRAVLVMQVPVHQLILSVQLYQEIIIN